MRRTGRHLVAQHFAARDVVAWHPVARTAVCDAATRAEGERSGVARSAAPGLGPPAPAGR